MADYEDDWNMNVVLASSADLITRKLLWLAQDEIARGDGIVG
jgi:hypothetical protein